MPPTSKTPAGIGNGVAVLAPFLILSAALSLWELLDCLIFLGGLGLVAVVVCRLAGWLFQGMAGKGARGNRVEPARLIPKPGGGWYVSNEYQRKRAQPVERPAAPVIPMVVVDEDWEEELPEGWEDLDKLPPV